MAAVDVMVIKLTRDECLWLMSSLRELGEFHGAHTVLRMM